MNLVDQINQHTYLFLTEIGEPEDNVLRLVIEEARASGEPEDMKRSGGHRVRPQPQRVA